MGPLWTPRQSAAYQMRKTESKFLDFVRLKSYVFIIANRGQKGNGILFGARKSFFSRSAHRLLHYFDGIYVSLVISTCSAARTPGSPEGTPSGCRESREARNRASFAPPRAGALIENREAVFFLPHRRCVFHRLSIDFLHQGML